MNARFSSPISILVGSHFFACVVHVLLIWHYHIILIIWHFVEGGPKGAGSARGVFPEAVRWNSYSILAARVPLLFAFVVRQSAVRVFG